MSPPKNSLMGSYLLSSQDNVAPFLRAMGAPEAYVGIAASEQMVGKEKFVLKKKDGEEGVYEMGDPDKALSPFTFGEPFSQPQPNGATVKNVITMGDNEDLIIRKIVVTSPDGAEHEVNSEWKFGDNELTMVQKVGDITATKVYKKKQD